VASAPALINNQPKSRLGGARPGAGRKKGSPNKSTAEIKAIAQPYSEQAVKTLAQIMQTGESEGARVSAANAILDRAWGKPSQAVLHSDPDGGPIKHLHGLSDEALAAIALGRR
jgi:hypothetical protein